MFEAFSFTRVDGSRKTPRIQILALSTCGFCRRGMEFLESLSFEYDYIHLDKLPQEEKNKLKEEFKEKFQCNLSYPAMILDGQKHVIGFVKRVWEENLGFNLDQVMEVEPLE